MSERKRGYWVHLECGHDRLLHVGSDPKHLYTCVRCDPKRLRKFRVQEPIPEPPWRGRKLAGDERDAKRKKS